MAEQRSTLIIEISSEQAARNARALDRELQSIERTGNYATTSMNSMSVAARQLAGYLAGVVTVGTAISKMDTYTGLNNKLKLVTKSQSELNTAMNDTFKIAQNTAQAWDSVAQIYQRFSDNAQRLNITQVKTAELTDTVAKAIAISGGSAASAEAALVQFSQALASNVLRGEELNSVMEQAPGLAKAIAQGMGITVGQLRSVAAEGKITGDVLVDALTKARGSVNELFGKTDFTIAQSFTQLSNAVTKFVGEAGKGSGAASAISNSLSSLANNLDTVTNIAMIGGAYWLGTYIPALYKSVAAQQTRITTLVSEVRAEQLANEITAQRTARIAHLSTIELANAEAQLARMTGMARIAYLEKTVLPLRQANTAALQADTIAQNANNASKSLATRAGTSLIGVLGGPVGLGLTVAAVGASMLLMGDNTESATTSLENQKKTVSELTAEYGKLSTAKLVSEMDEIDKRVSAAESKISKSKNGLLGMVAGNSDSISNEEIKRQNLILDQLKKIEKEGLSTASALQAIDASKLFTDGEIKQAQKFFAKMEEGNNELARGTAQRQLANSALDKASGIYENLAKESSNLTLEQERLTSSLESAKSGFSFVSDSLLQSAANAGVSKDGIEQLKKSINAYSAGALSATALLKEFQKYIPIKDSDLKSYLQIANNVEAQQKALTLNEIQLKKNKSTQDGLNKSLSDSNITGTNFNKVLEDGTKKAVATSESVKGLSAEIQKFINQSLSDISTNSEILALRAKGISKEVAENYVKLKEAQGLLGKNQPIDTGAFSLMMADLSIKQKIKDLDDLQAKSEKDRTKELEKQLKVLQVNEKVKANAAKYNFGGLESKYGLLPGLLSGVHMQESRGKADAVGPMTKYGTAKGGFQFLDDTAKRFKLTGSDVFDLGKSAEAAAKYLQILYKKFGSWDKAISAYHAGEGNVEKGTKIGPVNRQYVQNVKGYIAGTNGFEGSTKDFDTSVNDLVKFLQVKQDIELQYSSGEIQRKTEHEKKLSDIQSHFSGDIYTKLERQENERFANENRLAELQFDLNVRGWNWTNEQRIQNEIDTQKVTISLNKEYSDIQKQIAKEEVDEKFAYELKKFRETQLLKQLEYNMQYTDRVNTARDRIAQYSLNPFDYQKSALASSQSQAYASNNKAYSDDLKVADDALRKGEIDQEQHFQRMLNAKRLYTDNDLAISLEHKRKEEELVKAQYQNQLQIWGNLLSSGQTMWSQMTQSVKDASGEQSNSYKTMFAMQQAFSIASTLVAAHVAAAQTTADITLPFVGKVPAASAILAFGYAQAGLIASQTIAGFATGGPITGKGTATSDDIPIMASNGEFMMRQYAASKIGLVALNYMNQTGEIPFQREYHGMKTQFLGSTQPDLNVQKFKDGGLVGVSRINNADVERSQFDSILQRNAGSSQPKVTIINQTSQPVEASSQWDGTELKVVLKEMQKQNEVQTKSLIAQSWRDAERQGGPLDRIKKSR